MGQAINYNPHQIISKRSQANKNKPFKHTEIDGLREEANLEDYPNYTTKDISMEQDSASSLPGNNSSQMNLSNIVAMAGNVSSLVSFSESTKKREHVEPMDTNEIYTASAPKKQKFEQEQ